VIIGRRHHTQPFEFFKKLKSRIWKLSTLGRNSTSTNKENILNFLNLKLFIWKMELIIHIGLSHLPLPVQKYWHSHSLMGWPLLYPAEWSSVNHQLVERREGLLEGLRASWPESKGRAGRPPAPS
jgi:hypothetical protein